MNAQPALNALLRRLPSADVSRLAPSLHAVSLRAGERLYATGDRLYSVLFPIDCIISLMHVLSDGAASELALVGNDGVVGITLILGGDRAPNGATVRSAGTALRLDLRPLNQELERRGPFRDLLLRYIQALITQMAQTAVCNRHHAVEQQLARWLLMTIDRLPRTSLSMTQEMIAGTLGVRREGVTAAARRLQSLGAIRYSRGVIEVVDRAGLEQRCCECYAVVRDEMERLLNQAPLTQGS